MLPKRRVLLISAHPLLSEGLANVLGRLEDVLLMGPRAVSECTLAEVRASAPDVVLFAAQDTDEPTENALLVQILQHIPGLPVIQIGLAGNTALHVYTSYTLPARSVDLIDIMRKFPLQGSDKTAKDNARLKD